MFIRVVDLINIIAQNITGTLEARQGTDQLRQRANLLSQAIANPRETRGAVLAEVWMPLLVADA